MARKSRNTHPNYVFRSKPSNYAETELEKVRETTLKLGFYAENLRERSVLNPRLAGSYQLTEDLGSLFPPTRKFSTYALIGARDSEAPRAIPAPGRAPSPHLELQPPRSSATP